ncbi:hypothetical protein N1851_027393 [Merluccius polli]|uniref:Uncharacterized protein n=1 Tax=Merluccius polli TaxID=89951 RepID=A0AA47MAB4_MERPO|nr:hypothetical protein N1851_027393 [Merluccius polli]
MTSSQHAHGLCVDSGLRLSPRPGPRVRCWVRGWRVRRPKAKREYKKSNKTSTSRVEGEPDDSTPIKRKKNRKTYTRWKKSAISVSVEKSDSLVVAHVPKVSGSKKYHQKKNYCLYCGVPQSKIARHLERKHGDKREVANAVMRAKHTKERRDQLDLLRKQGNRAHNIDALTKGKGTLVPCKQQSDNSSPKACKALLCMLWVLQAQISVEACKTVLTCSKCSQNTTWKNKNTDTLCICSTCTKRREHEGMGPREWHDSR